MKIPMLTAAFLAAAACPAGAQEANLSQHPRAGELAVIDFSRASAEIPQDRDMKLGEIAGWAKDHPDGLIVIDGYPDRVDDTAIALRRVEAVRDRLIAVGVEPARVVVAAFAAPARPRVIISGTHQEVADVVATHGAAAAVVWGGG